MTNKIIYRFRRFTPIYKAKDKICIGFIERENNYLELESNEDNLNRVKSLLKYGICESDISIFPYNLFYQKDFLTINPGISNNRADLFIEYVRQNSKCESDYIEDYKERNILVFGAGAGGSTLITLLAQHGFRNITVIDFDSIEESDIYRILTYNKKDIGKPKTTVLREQILNNYNIDIKTLNCELLEEKELEATIMEISPDFIVKACDPNGLFVYNLNKICFNHSIPFIMMAYSYEYVKAGPLYVPGITSCNQNNSSYMMERFGEHYNIKYFERMFSDYIFHPSISFNINILASMIFKEILFFLIGDFENCQTIGRLISFNSLKTEIYTHLAQCTNCNICNKNG